VSICKTDANHLPIEKKNYHKELSEKVNQFALQQLDNIHKSRENNTKKNE